MKQALAESFMARIGTAGALASAVLFMAPLHAQDQSLAGRVSQLEQWAQNRDQSSLKTFNQLQQMQTQMQQMQGQIEVLQHQVQELQSTSKSQYAGLDIRLGRLERASALQEQAAKQAATAKPAAGAPSAPASSGGATPARVLAPSRPTAAMKAAYEAAFKSLRDGHYVDASTGFRDYIEKNPVNTLTPNAFYWLGEAYYAMTNYQIAQDAFQHVLQQFPHSEKAPAALLKLGYSQLELKHQAEAVATLKSVVAKYPGTRVASLAQERLHRLESAPAH